jgi:archaellum component FlaC
MEEEDIEDCIKRVNAVDNGIMIFAQNMNQKMENLKNTKKKIFG